MSVKPQSPRQTLGNPENAPVITGKRIAETNRHHGKKLVRSGVDDSRCL
jgi:hypothetical protein